MFKDIISKLSLHPSAPGRLKRYYRARQREDALRRLALLLSVLTLCVQIALFISPPDFTMAALSGPAADVAAWLFGMPPLNPIISLVVLVSVAVLSGYLYLRNRQLLKEAGQLHRGGNR